MWEANSVLHEWKWFWVPGQNFGRAAYFVLNEPILGFWDNFGNFGPKVVLGPKLLVMSCNRKCKSLQISSGGSLSNVLNHQGHVSGGSLGGSTAANMVEGRMSPQGHVFQHLGGGTLAINGQGTYSFPQKVSNCNSTKNWPNLHKIVDFGVHELKLNLN